MRTDRGTENIDIKQIQESFENCIYIAGTSIANQRIEQYWGQPRKECIEFWISLFHGLQECGDYLGDYVDKNVLQFCFMPIIQVSFK